MKVRIGEWFFTISAFIVSFYLYSLFSYFGIRQFFKESVLSEYFETNLWHVEIIVIGILFGSLFVIINRLTENSALRKRSFGFIILLKSTLYLVALTLVCVLLLFAFRFLGLMSDEMLNEFGRLLSFEFLLSFLLFVAITIISLNFIQSINKKFGPGFLISLLTGEYHHPKNEELVFLFLDLKDSTRIAEQMGHKKYSSFIKECVHELTPAILKYRARVYQYVGDEVVLFWDVKNGFKESNCLKTFFEFKSTLNRKHTSFLAKYGEAPVFKAGMDAGVVTVTEIGDIKREIAFHSDVLNTASRLEKKCNDFDARLIVSQHVMDRIQSSEDYKLEFLSDLPLKGKNEHLKFYAVHSN